MSEILETVSSASLENLEKELENLKDVIEKKNISCFIIHPYTDNKEDEKRINQFERHLDQAGFITYYSYRKDNRGCFMSDSLDHFSDKIFETDFNIILCTPDLKKKYINGEDHVVVNEINKAYERMDENNIISILVSGNKNESMPIDSMHFYSRPVFDHRDFFENYCENLSDIFEELLINLDSVRNNKKESNNSGIMEKELETIFEDEELDCNMLSEKRKEYNKKVGKKNYSVKEPYEQIMKITYKEVKNMNIPEMKRRILKNAWDIGNKINNKTEEVQTFMRQIKEDYEDTYPSLFRGKYSTKESFINSIELPSINSNADFHMCYQNQFEDYAYRGEFIGAKTGQYFEIKKKPGETIVQIIINLKKHSNYIKNHSNSLKKNEVTYYFKNYINFVGVKFLDIKNNKMRVENVGNVEGEIYSFEIGVGENITMMSGKFDQTHNGCPYSLKLSSNKKNMIFGRNKSKKEETNNKDLATQDINFEIKVPNGYKVVGLCGITGDYFDAIRGIGFLYEDAEQEIRENQKMKPNRNWLMNYIFSYFFPKHKVTPY